MARDHSKPENRPSLSSRESGENRVSKPRRQQPPQILFPRNTTAIRSSRSLIDIIKSLSSAEAGKWQVVIQEDCGRTFRATSEIPHVQEITLPDVPQGIQSGPDSLRPHASEEGPSSPGHAISIGHPVRNYQRTLYRLPVLPVKQEDRSIPRPQQLRLECDDAGSHKTLPKVEHVIDSTVSETRRVAFDRIQVNVEDVGTKYRDMFKLLRQKGCKKVVQAWLRKVHLQKQSTCPYNGGPDAESHPDYDPRNKGKHKAPIYWPSQENWSEATSGACRHKEPDHQKKHERLNLLCHLLHIGARYSDSGFDFSVPVLRESTRNIILHHPCHFQEGAAEILDDIYECRIAEDQFERGEIDGDATVWISAPYRAKLSRDASLLCHNALKMEEDSDSEGEEDDPEGEDAVSTSSRSIKRESCDDMDLDGPEEFEGNDSTNGSQQTALPVRTAFDRDLPSTTTAVDACVPQRTTNDKVPPSYSAQRQPKHATHSQYQTLHRPLEPKISSQVVDGRISYPDAAQAYPTDMANHLSMPRHMTLQMNKENLGASFPGFTNDFTFSAPSDTCALEYPDDKRIIKMDDDADASSSGSYAQGALRHPSQVGVGAFDFLPQPLSRDTSQQSCSASSVPTLLSLSSSAGLETDKFAAADMSYTLNKDWYPTIYDGPNYLENTYTSDVSPSSSFKGAFPDSFDYSQNMPLHVNSDFRMQPVFGTGYN